MSGLVAHEMSASSFAFLWAGVGKAEPCPRRPQAPAVERAYAADRFGRLGRAASRLRCSDPIDVARGRSPVIRPGLHECGAWP